MHEAEEACPVSGPPVPPSGPPPAQDPEELLRVLQQLIQHSKEEQQIEQLCRIFERSSSDEQLLSRETLTALQSAINGLVQFNVDPRSLPPGLLPQLARLKDSLEATNALHNTASASASAAAPSASPCRGSPSSSSPSSLSPCQIDSYPLLMPSLTLPASMDSACSNRQPQQQQHLLQNQIHVPGSPMMASVSPRGGVPPQLIPLRTLSGSPVRLTSGSPTVSCSAASCFDMGQSSHTQLTPLSPGRDPQHVTQQRIPHGDNSVTNTTGYDAHTCYTNQSPTPGPTIPVQSVQGPVLSSGIDCAHQVEVNFPQLHALLSLLRRGSSATPYPTQSSVHTSSSQRSFPVCSSPSPPFLTRCHSPSSSASFQQQHQNRTIAPSPPAQQLSPSILCQQHSSDRMTDSNQFLPPSPPHFFTTTTTSSSAASDNATSNSPSMSSPTTAKASSPLFRGSMMMSSPGHSSNSSVSSEDEDSEQESEALIEYSPSHSPNHGSNPGEELALTTTSSTTTSSRPRRHPSHSQASGRRYVDITEYLCLPQKEAAARLGMKNTTLSKHFAAVVNKSRKWPYRRIKQIDKEIKSARESVPEGQPLPPEVEEKIRILEAKRQMEMKPVVIPL
ncbi:hypothetical protein Pelo_9556 [Pelomyxa schiedti]|nr:hypothetical protein Pelo_9556 [Pelomyxa schiedti]